VAGIIEEPDFGTLDASPEVAHCRFHLLLGSVLEVADLEPDRFERRLDVAGVVDRIRERRLFVGAVSDHQRQALAGSGRRRRGDQCQEQREAECREGDASPRSHRFTPSGPPVGPTILYSNLSSGCPQMATKERQFNDTRLWEIQPEAYGVRRKRGRRWTTMDN
jgi:hypothetical protein